MARDRDLVRKALCATREGIAAVRAHGFPIEPPAMRWFLAMPDFLVVPMTQRLLATPLMDIGGTRHALAARDEMTVLNEELRAMADAAGMAVPTLRALQRGAGPSWADHGGWPLTEQ